MARKRKPPSVLSNRKQHSRLKALVEIGVGVGPDGYGIGKLFEMAETLGNLKSTNNEAFTKRARTKGEIERRKAGAKRYHRERRRAVKESIAAKARERARRTWPARTAHGLLPMKVAPMLEMVPGEWRTLDAPPGIPGRLVAMGWLETGERLPSGVVLPSGFEVPGKVLYRMTAEGEAAASFLWHCAALTALGWRRPAIGKDCELVRYWIRGEDVPVRNKGKASDKAVYPGDGDEFTWRDFGKWPLGAL